MQSTQAIEKIQTGLTANYVPQWTVIQGLKEAMQNIAYGAIKAEKRAKLYFDTKEQMWAIKDKFTGFGKRHLYIGESEQRDDADGLGNFGEGWKIFLLVMARNNVQHHVSTVGFTFWGSMEDTPHGTQVLTINIIENEQASGTRVYADVPEADWLKATESFAILQGIELEHIQNECMIPNRSGELWVQGVRIENNDTTNPLKLHYSYNLRQRDLINRDRSHVDVEKAYYAIKKLIWKMNEAEIKEFVSLALQGKDGEDILRGPDVPMYSEGEQKALWLEILAELHATTPEKLIIPSYNSAVNDEAKRRKFVLLDTPRRWEFEMSYLGIRKADDVIDDRYNIVEEGYTGGKSREDKSLLAKARTKMKRCFKLSSVDQLPTFQYVTEIKNPVDQVVKKAHYEPETKVLYLVPNLIQDEEELVKLLLPELITWKYAPRTTEEYEQAYKEVILNLLF